MIAIVGAGPYGLSIAAHLRERGVPCRIFGVAMQTWLTQMPLGMSLKSEGFASSLYDANGAFPLSRFCEERGLPYADVGIPVTLQTFCSYGQAFAERFVPDLDTRSVTQLARANESFSLTLDDGEAVRAERVVVAVGISRYSWMPEELTGAPEAFVTHTSAHRDVSRFRGRRVTVVGSGASAIDIAALLHEAGATTQLVARAARLTFHKPPRLKRPLYERLSRPRSGLGPNLKSYLYCEFPDAFSLLPAAGRVQIVRRHLGPSACWFTKSQFVGKVETFLGRSIESVAIRDERVRLQVRDAAGRAQEIVSDHLIAGTGYRVDLRRLAFLPETMRARVKVVDGAPELDRNFESSIPGLYFVGVSAAMTFGPLLRFAFGARFAAQRLSTHLARVTERELVSA